MKIYLVKATPSTLFAEDIGSFALVMVGCGAIVANDLYGSSFGNPGIGIVFGLVVMVMIYSVGNISGAHFNPAVTTLGATLPAIDTARAFVLEVLGAFILMFVVIKCVQRALRKRHYGWCCDWWRGGDAGNFCWASHWRSMQPGTLPGSGTGKQATGITVALSARPSLWYLPDEPELPFGAGNRLLPGRNRIAFQLRRRKSASH